MKTQNKKRKPTKRVFQAAGAVVPAKIKRIQSHLGELKNGVLVNRHDRQAIERLSALERL